MYRAFKQYSNPFQPYRHDLDALIVQSHAAASTNALMKKIEDNCKEADENFHELSLYVLRNIDTLNDAFEPFWDVAFGRVQRCLEDNTVSPLDAIGLAALRIAGFGATGSCSGKFSKPLRVQWGEYLLPCIDEFSLYSGGGKLTLAGILNGQESFVLERRPEGTQINVLVKPGAEPLAKPLGIHMISGNSVMEDVIVEDEFHAIFSYPEIGPAILEEYTRGLEMLSLVPEYRQWVYRLVRGIVVCETLESRTRSSSWSEAPGLVLVSRSSRDFLIAEMLVHEASHQYYNLACRCGSMVTGTCEDLYYSPAVGKARPLNKLLLGYHAFGNMYLFYQMCMQSGRGNPEIEGTAAQLEEKLKIFELPLLESGGMSEIGSALFEPLYQKICEVRK